MSEDLLVRQFADAPRHFETSPLYARLGAVVAADERLLAIAAEVRAGQLPQNLLMAAVHYLLLRDPAHELAAWYPSIVGAASRPAGAPRPSEAATGRSDGVPGASEAGVEPPGGMPARSAHDPGPAFTDFCLTRRQEIVELMRTRLVQTNVVKRAAILRLGLSAIASLTDEPVTLIEVGCSAGAHLRFDEYRYDVGGRMWGRPDSPVLISTRWEGSHPQPDLDRLPVIADRVGVDLNPIDVTDPDERLWLRALIWPENLDQADLQSAALHVGADDPPRTVAGDAVEVLPRLVAEVRPGTPVVVFHAATRLHVPVDRRESFDDAIRAIGRSHELFHLSFEASRDLDASVFALELRRNDGGRRLLAVADGHAEWIADPDGRTD